MSSTAYGLTVSITSIFAFFGTCVFLLDGSRVKHHCNAILEDRYPSTMYVVRHSAGFGFANFSSCIGFIVALASAIVHLYYGGFDNVAQTDNFFATSIMEFVTSILIAPTLLLLCLCTLYPSLCFAVEQKEKNAEKFIRQLVTGFIVIAVGSVSSGALALVLAFDPGALALSTIRIVNVIACIGSIVLVLATWPNNEAICKIRLAKAYTWDNVYHPSNYVLLASIWFLGGSVCKCLQVYSLGWLLYSWAFALLLLHFNMAFYGGKQGESMNLQPTSKEVNEEEVNNNENIDPGNFDFKTPDESVDVIISGAGISGLFLACSLCKKGVTVALCETYCHLFHIKPNRILNLS